MGRQTPLTKGIIQYSPRDFDSTEQTDVAIFSRAVIASGCVTNAIPEPIGMKGCPGDIEGEDPGIAAFFLTIRYNRRNTSTALSPPNANEFEIAYSTSAVRAQFGM